MDMSEEKVADSQKSCCCKPKDAPPVVNKPRQKSCCAKSASNDETGS